MLEIRTQSMDANFYSNIELGGRGDFFPTFETKVVELDISHCRSFLVSAQLPVGDTVTSLCHVLGQDILFSECLCPPGCVNGYQ